MPNNTGRACGEDRPGDTLPDDLYDLLEVFELADEIERRVEPGAEPGVGLGVLGLMFALSAPPPVTDVDERLSRLEADNAQLRRVLGAVGSLLVDEELLRDDSGR